jgi:hypothetical protein
MVFIRPSTQTPESYLQSGPNRFLSHPYQFIIHHPTIWCYILWATDSVVKSSMKCKRLA